MPDGCLSLKDSALRDLLFAFLAPGIDCLPTFLLPQYEESRVGNYSTSDIPVADE